MIDISHLKFPKTKDTVRHVLEEDLFLCDGPHREHVEPKDSEIFLSRGENCRIVALRKATSWGQSVFSHEQSNEQMSYRFTLKITIPANICSFYQNEKGKWYVISALVPKLQPVNEPAQTMDQIIAVFDDNCKLVSDENRIYLTK